MANEAQVAEEKKPQEGSIPQGNYGAGEGDKDQGGKHEAPKEEPKRLVDPKKKARNIAIGIVVVVVLLVGGFFWWLHARSYEDTDDAQVDGHLHPLSSRVDGTVERVAVEDNQAVQAGQLLVQLDPKDYQVALYQAQASVKQADAETATEQPNVPITQSSNTNKVETSNAEVMNAEASVAAAQQDEEGTGAQLRQAEANNAKSQIDLQRYTRLLEKHEVAQSDYDQYLTNARTQQANVEQQGAALRSSAKKVDQARAQLAEQRSKLAEDIRDGPKQVQIQEATLASKRASADSFRAQAETAKLHLAYTRIFAPVSGIVTNRSAEVGGQVSTGQQLMVIVQVDDLWVTANYRETQLKKIHPGQKVRLHVDSLGEDFDGYVDAMPAASGDRTTVLPPENATGNYVKIVQRLPVRIRFSAGQQDLVRLRPGMSVEPKIKLD